jgi:hypothetical protein
MKFYKIMRFEPACAPGNELACCIVEVEVEGFSAAMKLVTHSHVRVE